MTVSKLTAGASAQDVATPGTQERGVNIRAELETFDGAVDLETVVCLMFRQEIQFDIPRDRIPARAKAFFDRPVKFSVSFPAPSEEIGTLDCTAAGKDGSGDPVTAKASTKLNLADSSPVAGKPCVADSQTLCLGKNGELEVKAAYVDPAGRKGDASVIPQTRRSDSGAFWFFNERQVELTVAALGCDSPLRRYWNFSAQFETPLQTSLSVRNVPQGTQSFFGNGNSRVEDQTTLGCPGS